MQVQVLSSYSRSCPSSVRRQPVILTQAEKDKIDAEHPGSYEHAIEYQTSPDTPKYYYICPRYWSLKDDVSLTQADVDSGKYGNVIPRSAKSVPLALVFMSLIVAIIEMMMANILALRLDLSNLQNIQIINVYHVAIKIGILLHK